MWATCPTHGPIQSASPVLRGGEVVRLVCDCGLDCEAFTPEGFVEHDELKTLVVSHTQPGLGPNLGETIPLFTEPIPVGGGWFELPDGRKIQGLANARKAV